MTELEERMFRLSEALRSLEPENASRLRLALKFSREELILAPDEGDPEAAQGRPAEQGRDGSPRAAGQARAPPQPAAGRGPRLPDEAGAAAPDARDARPARADHQGREARAGLVAHGRRAASRAGEAARAGEPTSRRSSATRKRSIDDTAGRGRKNGAAAEGSQGRDRAREARHPEDGGDARRRPAVREPPARVPETGRRPPG